MNEFVLNAGWSFAELIQNFLGILKAENYIEFVENMLFSFNSLRCNISNKINDLHSQLDRYPENFSEEQGERFHQDIKTMETRNQG